MKRPSAFTDMFENSLVSKELFRYFNTKFGQVVTPKALLKSCATVSCKLERPRLSVMDVAPSRCLKTYTSTEVMDIFDRDFYIDIRSDFTIHALKWYEQKLLEGKCIFVNDGTTQFASKSQRTKDRLVSGLSELLADEIYTYEDFGQKFALKGKVTLVMNITSEAYQNYKDRLFGLTFSERFLTIHHVLTEPEKDEWVEKEERTKGMRFRRVITEDDIETEVEIPRKYYDIIKYLAEDFSYLSLRTFIGCQDLIKGTLKAHASLNQRNCICQDDIDFLRMIKDYLINPFSPYEGKIIRLRAHGFSYRDICKVIGKPNYLQQVQRVCQKAELRGVLPYGEKEQSIRHNRGRLRKSGIRASEEAYSRFP